MKEGQEKIVPGDPKERQITVLDLIGILEDYPPDLPVWIAHSDDPENCYHRMRRDDVERCNIWLTDAPSDDGPVEVPGVVIGGRWFSP